jgi:hypothetical protein
MGVLRDTLAGEVSPAGVLFVLSPPWLLPGRGTSEAGGGVFFKAVKNPSVSLREPPPPESRGRRKKGF